jgi:hypothetical protein
MCIICAKGSLNDYLDLKHMEKEFKKLKDQERKELILKTKSRIKELKLNKNAETEFELIALDCVLQISGKFL